jgi:hypothetical protein
MVFCLAEIALGMGTSELLDIGTNDYKRHTSMHRAGAPEKVVNIIDNWKTKKQVTDCPIANMPTHERIFVPANNVERKKEDGCMNKIKIERTLKLRQEDFKGRGKFNILTGAEQGDSGWIGSFGKQVSMLSNRSSTTKAGGAYNSII